MSEEHLFDYIKFLKWALGEKIKNPFLDELKKIVFSAETREEGMDALLEKRNTLIEKYCFSIPFSFVLEEVKKYSPLTELGAGTGYYSYCLRQIGADIDPYDLYSPDFEDPFDFMNKNLWFEDT